MSMARTPTVWTSLKDVMERNSIVRFPDRNELTAVPMFIWVSSR